MSALPNPYVGPRFFEAQDRQYFFGRDKEIRILTGLVLARRVVLLFAKSGVGKSSLLRAGLVPQLTEYPMTVGRRRRIRQTEERMTVLPVTYVGRGLEGVSTANIFVQSLFTTLAAEGAPVAVSAPTLVAGLAPLFVVPPADAEDEVRPVLLILDQFEELFTRHLDQWPARAAFFHELNAALAEYPRLHLLFAMREDYIGELVPYADLLPDRMRSRFRLEPFGREAALAAIVEPAAAAGRTFTAEAATALVDNLSRLQFIPAPTLDATTDGLDLTAALAQSAAAIGGTIEPVHLQIVCRELWDTLPADRTEILPADLEDYGDVDKALSDFYNRTIRQTVATTAVSERRLRRWFGEALITPAGTRDLVRDDETTYADDGLSVAALQHLRDAYLIRANPRGNDLWYELAHDRLVPPIIKANRQWLDIYHNPLLLPTRVWLQAGRQSTLLLTGTLLMQARRYVEEHPKEILAEEQELLDASLRQARRRRARLISSSGALLIGVLLLWLLVRYMATTEEQARIVRQRTAAGLAGQVSELAQRDEIDGAARIGALAGHLIEVDAGVSPEVARDVVDGLHGILAYPIQQVYSATTHTAGILDLAWSPDNRYLLSTSDDGTARIWAAQDASAKAILVASPTPLAIRFGLWSDDGRQIVTVARSGQVALWDVGDLATISEPLLLAQPLTAIITDTGNILSVDWDRQTNRLLSTGTAGIVWIWDLTRGELLQTIAAHGGYASFIRWDRRHERILTTGGDDKAVIWDAENGRMLQVFDVPGGKLWGAAFSSDESAIVTYGYDATLRIWDVATATLITAFRGQAIGVVQARWNRVEDRLLTAASDGQAIVWNTDPGSNLVGSVDTLLPVRAFSTATPPPRVFDAGWNRYDSRILTVSDERMARIWNARDGTLLAALPHQDPVTAGVWMGDGTRVATGDSKGTVKIWTTASPYLIHGHAEPPLTVALKQDETQILTTGQDGQAYLWNTATGMEDATLVGHVGEVWRARWNRDGRLLLTAGEDGTARLWDGKTGAPLAVLGPHTGHVRYARWSPDQTEILTDDESGFGNVNGVRVWSVDPLDPSNIRLRAALTGTHSAPVNAAYWSDDMTRMLTASQDGFVCQWNIDSATTDFCVNHSAGITEANRIGVVEALWRGTDESQFLSYGYDGTIKVWASATPGEEPTLRFTLSHDGFVLGAHWIDQNSQILSYSVDGTVRIWDGKTGALLRTFAGPVGSVRKASWDETGQRLVTAGDDATIRLWNLATGDLIQTFLGHDATVRGVRWNAKRTQLLSYSDDGTARIWEIASGEEIRRFSGHNGALITAQWFDDEQRVLTAGVDGTVRQYFLQLPDLQAAVCQRLGTYTISKEEWHSLVGDIPYAGDGQICP